MKQTKKIEIVLRIARERRMFDELKKIEKSLNRLDTKSANGEIEEEKYEAFEEQYMNLAQDLADKFGLLAYHQRDCRGVSLYLVWDKKPDVSYTNGLAII